MSNGDAGNGGPAQVVVRYQKSIGDFSQDFDLLSHVFDVGPAGGLDLDEG
jgi:hypothetical protein